MVKKKKEKKSLSLLPEASRFIIIIVIGSKYNTKKKKKLEVMANIRRYLVKRNLSVKIDYFYNLYGYKLIP